MLKAALEYFTSIVAGSQVPHVIDINGKKLVDRKLNRYDCKDYAEQINIQTLTGLIDYISAGELPTGCFIRVVDPENVVIQTPLDEYRKRETLIRCTAGTPYFRYNSWMEQEEFIIGLQACFQPTDDLALVRKFAGTVEASTISTYGDDGITQKAQIQTGIASKSEVICPNPVILKPYRTFSEISSQPESAFVFRVKNENGKPYFKLIEADGGAWKSEAMDAVAQWIEAHIPDDAFPADIPGRAYTIIS